MKKFPRPHLLCSFPPPALLPLPSYSTSFRVGLRTSRSRNQSSLLSCPSQERSQFRQGHGQSHRNRLIDSFRLEKLISILFAVVVDYSLQRVSPFRQWWSSRSGRSSRSTSGCRSSSTETGCSGCTIGSGHSLRVAFRSRSLSFLSMLNLESPLQRKVKSELQLATRCEERSRSFIERRASEL